ncbi:MAG TPA: hypothetical protein VHY91_06265 [Pirellulales bacterium]|jgi:hypothetical protein|nr:hypothetical protein [Pirellulales bacterium]
MKILAKNGQLMPPCLFNRPSPPLCPPGRGSIDPGPTNSTVGWPLPFLPASGECGDPSLGAPNDGQKKLPINLWLDLGHFSHLLSGNGHLTTDRQPFMVNLWETRENLSSRSRFFSA